jgi:hypothetical protein
MYDGNADEHIISILSGNNIKYTKIEQLNLYNLINIRRL